MSATLPAGDPLLLPFQIDKYSLVRGEPLWKNVASVLNSAADESQSMKSGPDKLKSLAIENAELMRTTPLRQETKTDLTSQRLVPP